MVGLQSQQSPLQYARVSLDIGDQSGKGLLRRSQTRRVRPLKTLTESRLQITSSVRIMAKGNKMLLSTTQWRYRYLVACVIQIDHYGVPLLVAVFLCVRFTMDSLLWFYYKKGETVKLPTWVQLHPDHLVRENEERRYFIGAFQQELENREDQKQK